ncbi:hypothetical protein [Phenylobacterium sp.]|uniref:hypothetical protein n=1 Tax=Phenylobacterium sp. TaxID=1871053 RepID=UPI003BAA271C
MRILPLAEFTSDFPEDGIEDDDGVLQFGGRAVTEAIVDILKGFGFRVSPPEYDEHGWGFDFYASERRFWCQVTALDTFLFSCDDVSRTLMDKILKRPPNAIYIDVMTRLGEALGRHPRFHHVRWYVDDSSRSPGAASPVKLDD